MVRDCPMCGRPLEAEDSAGGLIVCPACGTAVSERAGGRSIDPEAARQKVRWPAVGLMIAGGLMILSGMTFPALIGIDVASGGFADADDPGRNDALIGLAVLGVLGLAALGLGGGVIFGGYRMYRLRSWAIAFTASLLSIASIFGCCVFSVFGVLFLPAFPIGIWAMVVLCDANVKAAFR